MCSPPRSVAYPDSPVGSEELSFFISKPLLEHSISRHGPRNGLPDVALEICPGARISYLRISQSTPRARPRATRKDIHHVTPNKVSITQPYNDLHRGTDGKCKVLSIRNTLHRPRDFTHWKNKSMVIQLSHELSFNQ